MASGVVLHCGNPPIANNRTPQNRKSFTRSCLNFEDFTAQGATPLSLPAVAPARAPRFLDIGLGQHRKLQDQHGSARGRDGKKRLPNPCEKIAFVVHVSAPLTETDRTGNTMRPCPIHNKRSS